LPRVAGLRATRCVTYDNPEAERNRLRVAEHMVMDRGWACTLQGWTTRSVRSCQREATNMRSAPDPEMRSTCLYTCPALYLADAPRRSASKVPGVWVEEPSARDTLPGKFVSK
jgi:hypothetical protein